MRTGLPKRICVTQDVYDQATAGRMIMPMLRAAIALGIAALWSGSALAQFAPTPAMIQRKIAEDVYTMQHPLGSSNSTFVVTPDGVLVFDADIRTGRPGDGGDPAHHRQEGQVSGDLASLRRSLDRRLALPRGQAARHRHPQADARPVHAGARGVQRATRPRTSRASASTRARSWCGPTSASTAR